jgi:hypothetical protein
MGKMQRTILVLIQSRQNTSCLLLNMHGIKRAMKSDKRQKDNTLRANKYGENYTNRGIREALERQKDPVQKVKNTFTMIKFLTALLAPEYYLASSSIYHSATGRPEEAALDLAMIGVGRVLSKALAPSSTTPPRSTSPRFAGTSQGDIAVDPDLGLSRELRVAESVGGRVTRVGKQDAKLYLPSGKPVVVKGKHLSTLQYPSKLGVKIDVIGPNQELIVVGGPAKAINLGDLGGNLSRLKQLADAHGVKALAYFEAGTPQSAIDMATKWLGKENVHIFP